MRIEHVAIGTSELENMRDFYQSYFSMKCSNKYENIKKGFSSYFLSFESGARIEIMKRQDISHGSGERGAIFGLTHIAISVGDKASVDILTERLRLDEFKIVGEPRTTGDGYYESVILDPEGNHIEITE